MAERRRAKPGKAAGDPRAVGSRLRAARLAKQWTLAEVAGRAGMSVATLSRAEHGLLALSYEKFAALAAVLSADFGSLVAGDSVAALSEPLVTRSGTGSVYEGASITYEFLAAAASSKAMTPIRGVIRARRFTGAADFVRHAGQEFVFVLSGRLRVHFETGKSVELRRDDSLYFDSSIGHAYVSLSRQPAVIVGATTSESPAMGPPGGRTS